MELFTSKCLQCTALLFIFVSVEYTVEGISCYQCNSGASYNGSACDTLVEGQSDLFKMNCTNDSVFVYTRCRKTVQTVLGETRVIRSCATAGTGGSEPKCTDRLGTSKVKVKHCECNTDNCNTSSGFCSSVLLVVATALGNVFANAV